MSQTRSCPGYHRDRIRTLCFIYLCRWTSTSGLMVRQCGGLFFWAICSHNSPFDKQIKANQRYSREIQGERTSWDQANLRPLRIDEESTRLNEVRTMLANSREIQGERRPLWIEEELGDKMNSGQCWPIQKMFKESEDLFRSSKN